MLLKNIVIAAPSIQKLIDQDVPLRTAWQLSRLMDALNPALEFYGRELAKTAPERAEAAQEELLALDLPDVDPGILYLPLDLPVRLSAADIKRLGPFVRFSEPVSDLDTEKE